MSLDARWKIFKVAVKTASAISDELKKLAGDEFQFFAAEAMPEITAPPLGIPKMPDIERFKLEC